MGIFKAYDIRGTYPDDLDEALACKIGYAAGQVIGGRTWAIGRDIRLSGQALAEAFVDGLRRAGASVVDLGLVATPMLTFSVVRYGFDAGAMVTASHNPKEYNGFKLVRQEGRPVGWDSGIEEIERQVGALASLPEPVPEATVTPRDVLDDYVEHLTTFVRKIEGLTVAVDASHGMAGLYMTQLFERFGARLVPLYFNLDGTFPDHGPNPMKAENLQDLQRTVREAGADVGIALDGDADRVVFVDEQANVIPCDLIIALLAREALSKQSGETVVYDVRSSWAVREEIAALGGKPVMGRVGHSFMKRLLRETNGALAGELSGHYYFRENHFADDGAIAAIKLLNLCCQEGRSLSQLLKPLQRYFASGEVNSDVEDKQAKIAQIKAKFGAGKVAELDGLSVEFGDWWFNVRPSNTEPKLRLTVEARTRELMEQKRDELLAVIRAESH